MSLDSVTEPRTQNTKLLTAVITTRTRDRSVNQIYINKLTCCIETAKLPNKTPSRKRSSFYLRKIQPSCSWFYWYVFHCSIRTKLRFFPFLSWRDTSECRPIGTRGCSSPPPNNVTSCSVSKPIKTRAFLYRLTLECKLFLK